VTPLIPKFALQAHRRRAGLLGGHRRRHRPPILNLLLQENRRQPEIEIRRRLKLRRLLQPLAFAGGGDFVMRSGVREAASRVRVSDSPNVGACNFRGLVGGSSGRGQAHEPRQRPERAAAEYGLDGRLADVPVSGPEKAHRTVDGVDRSPASFEQQGLKQSCIGNRERSIR